MRVAATRSRNCPNRHLRPFAFFYQKAWCHQYLTILALRTMYCWLTAEQSVAAIGYSEHVRPSRGRIGQSVARLRQSMFEGALDDLAIEIHLVDIASSLAAEQEDIRRRIARLPLARRHTRAELFRRIHVARDYMHACYGNPLTLSLLANVAAMSMYHFIRTFRQVTGENAGHLSTTDTNLRGETPVADHG